MTTCDSPWILVAIVVPLAAVVGGTLFYAAARARGDHAAARSWLGISAGVSLLAGGAIAWISWGAGLATLLALAFLPSLLGALSALARPDPPRLKAAYLAATVTCIILVALVLALGVDAAMSAPCPGAGPAPA